MLELSNVTVQLAGADVLRGVSMAVPAGSFVSLVGRNGAGKTTLMRAVMNLIPVASGRVAIDGQDTTRSPAFLHARYGVGYLPEDRRLVPDWTVEQNVRLPAMASLRPDERARLAKIFALMPEVEKVRHRKALQLSGGQQKLVALARALMAATRLLILDEPFEGVAPALVQRLVEILSNMRANSALTVLISESDAIHSRGLVDRSFVIERGHVAG